MKCYKKTHQVSLPGFIVGFIALMALTAMLSGCGVSQPSDNPTNNPTVSVETPAPEQTDAPASDAPVVDTPATETPIEDYDTPMSFPVANKPAPGLPSVAINSDTVIEAGDETVYNFRTEGFTGCLLDGSTRSYELYYGIHAEVNGSRLVYRAYSYDETIVPVEAMFMRDSTENYFKMDISTEDKSIDLSNQANDAFTMFVTFSNGETCFMTVYVNDKTPYIVDSIYENADYVRKYILPKQDQLLELTEQFDVTPENSLGVTRKDITYPSADNYNYRCDTERWRDPLLTISSATTLSPTASKLLCSTIG